MIDIRHGDCIAEMRAMDDACVDSIVTDPPYELGFMGKGWDASGIANSVEMWREAYRVLKPGGHLLAFSGSRTYHRMVCAIEDAGFEIRDQIMWLYGSGFPKSLDVSKQLDKMAGAEREVIGRRPDADKLSFKGKDAGWDRPWMHDDEALERCRSITAPATPEAQQWAGFGTALKPAHEPIVVARKPLAEKTVAQNVLTHGTGALNIGACRVGTEIRTMVAEVPNMRRVDRGADGATNDGRDAENWAAYKSETGKAERTYTGRWPANCIHDGSPEVLDAFAAFGERKSGKPGIKRKTETSRAGWTESRAAGTQMPGYGDEGSAARFFYAAKASKSDRAGSTHPTIKPLSLMKYLCRLVTPPGGTVLDPFAGSGTTLQAAMEEGFAAIGIEQSAEYVNDIRNRISAAREGLGLFAVAAE